MENWSSEKRESTFGMEYHGKLGVEAFIVDDGEQCDKDDRNEVL